MGFWKEVKKSINSTLGTSSFKPLDKIMRYYTLGSKKFVPSDNTVISFLSTSMSLETARTLVGTFTPSISGLVNLKFRLDCLGGGIRVHITLTEDDTEVFDSSINYDSDEKGDIQTQLIELKEDKTYSIYAYTTITSSQGATSSGWINYVGIFGDILEDAFFNYSIGG